MIQSDSMTHYVSYLYLVAEIYHADILVPFSLWLRLTLGVKNCFFLQILSSISFSID